MGFRAPAAVAAMVRAWHHGRVRPTRSVRARELMTALMPTILSALGRTPHPDAAIRKFDAFLAGLPGGAQLFAQFPATHGPPSLVAATSGASPHFSHRPGRHT